MSNGNPDGLPHLLFGDLDQELAGTRRVLERVPTEALEWRPHERSMTLGGLASHVATLPFWPASILRESFFDVAAPFPEMPPQASREAILEQFDRASMLLKERLGSTADGDLLAPWSLLSGNTVLMEMSRAAAVRFWGLSHLVHHRGQLTLYLRLLDVPLPGLYGPTADERS
jgi:uncharacterized damage-inducible protein DinB